MTCNILLVGYGAVGIVVAYALQKTGNINVTAVARSNYQTICDGKIVLKSKQYGDIPGLKPFRGEVTVSLAGQSQSVRKLSDLAAVTRTVTEAADQPYDYVVITTKAIPELYPTSELVAPLLSSDYPYPQPMYVLMQNGLGVEKDLHAALQEKESTRSARIITGAIIITANIIGDTVFHSGYDNRFLGNFYRGEDGSLATTSSDEESFHRLVDLLNQGGCGAKADPYPQAAKFRKNLWNASFAMLSCLTRTQCDAFFGDELACQGSTSALLHTITTELIAVGKVLGHPSEYLNDPTQLLESYRKYHLGTTGFKPSTLLDVEAGRPFELEVILGEVVRQGKRFNVPIPALEMMYNTLNIVQRQLVLAVVNK